MDKIKVMTVFGTRPDAVKMAPLVKELKKYDKIESKVCVTGQHREMLDQVLELFDIDTDYDLNVMKAKQSLTGITCRVLQGIEGIFSEYRPDIVLIHGDTSTAFSTALSAFYHKIKVGHVEAGLRSFDKYFPYPEEMNRKLAGVIADLNFAPTPINKQNLLDEGINKETIYVTGNTVIDAMNTTVQEDYRFKSEELNNIDFKNKKVVMVTAHRRENWGQGINNICRALKYIAENNEDIEIVYLLHLNPIVKDEVEKQLKGIKRIHLLSPLDVKEAHNLQNKSHIILTDSGGLQEEAPHLGKPVLVLRGVTERQEAIKAGTVRLVGTDYDDIVCNTEALLNNQEEYNNMSNSVNPYGDGKASKRIVEAILHHFGIIKDKPEEFL